MTQGGAESVLDVGSESSMETAIGYVGVPHGSSHNFNLGRLFMQNITLRGGAVPARAYIPELLADRWQANSMLLRFSI